MLHRLGGTGGKKANTALSPNTCCLSAHRMLSTRMALVFNATLRGMGGVHRPSPTSGVADIMAKASSRRRGKTD